MCLPSRRSSASLCLRPLRLDHREGTPLSLAFPPDPQVSSIAPPDIPTTADEETDDRGKTRCHHQGAELAARTARTSETVEPIQRLSRVSLGSDAPTEALSVPAARRADRNSRCAWRAAVRYDVAADPSEGVNFVGTGRLFDALCAARTFRPKLARMSGGIYLLRGEHELVEMTEQPYDSEEILQTLIARFPSLLAGDQYGTDAPRRWLLIGREAALPDEEDGGGRWSVDHLFLDQDAVPTLVEVKRSSDTRIRREVIGQMLDYAANAVVYWPVERLRELLIRQAERTGRDADELVADAAGPEADIEGFWEQAGENLRAGKIRLVFVADQIPSELRRVIEFLNGQMIAEVLGIEVKQYVGEGVKTLVPRVIGQTAEVEARKGRRPPSIPGRRWDEQSLFADLEAKRGADETRAARDLYDWTLNQGMRAAFGAGKQDGSWTPVHPG